jgi:hypothetical protein
MNDIFAVQVFSLENLVTLLTMEAQNLCAVYSSLLFISSSAAFGIEHLDCQIHLELLLVSFYIFRDEIRIAMPEGSQKLCNPKFCDIRILLFLSIL